MTNLGFWNVAQADPAHLALVYPVTNVHTVDKDFLQPCLTGNRVAVWHFFVVLKLSDNFLWYALIKIRE